jgi:ribosomal protein S18 acetylase RimI-like enzyme
MFREYADAIGDEFWRDGFEDELARLPGYYDVLLVARDDADTLVGSVALKRLPDGAAELKRLYVRPSARGAGLGRALTEAAVARARERGYAVVRLDTLPGMEAARGIYASLGFVPAGRFSENPIPSAMFLELRL